MLKPDELLVEISHPVGVDRFTVSPLPNPLPLIVKDVVAPTVPCIVAGNVNEVGLTVSTGVTTGFTVPLTGKIDVSRLLWFTSSAQR